MVLFNKRRGVWEIYFNQISMKCPNLGFILVLWQANGRGGSNISVTTYCMQHVQMYFCKIFTWTYKIKCVDSSYVKVVSTLQAYWCVSYFRSKEAAILLHYQHGDLLPYLLEYPTGEFHVGQWLGYMRQLEERFTHLTVT